MKKGIITAFACALMVLAIPFGVKAEEGTRIHGDTMQQYAPKMDNAEHYYETSIVDGRDYYYKFYTGPQDGIHLISLASVVASNTTNGTVSVQVKDRYGTVVDAAAAGGVGANYRTLTNGKTLDVVIPVSGLALNEWYYICVNTNDGDPSQQIEVTTKISEKFVSFLPAADFKMQYGSGSLEFSWNNVQSANTYDPLKSFDGFQLELLGNNAIKYIYAGNGGTTKYSIATNDPELVSLGYPTSSVRVRLGCLQTYRSVFDDAFAVTKCVFSNTVINTEVTKKKAQSAVSGLKYKITKVKSDGTGTVTVLGFADANSKAKKVTIGSTIAYRGITYKVTAISAKAFAGNKYLNTVEIGENVTTIGNSAFDGCTALKKVNIKAKKLKKVGKRAFVNVKNKVKVTCPTKTLKTKYKKLLKNKINSSATYENL